MPDEPGHAKVREFVDMGVGARPCEVLMEQLASLWTGAVEHDSVI